MALTEEQLAFVRETALTPLGQNVAPAIVTCIIYFLYLGPAIYSFLSTKSLVQLLFANTKKFPAEFAWYDMVIISCTFRGIAMACKAAYLSHYSPALQGTFLAFFNAGFSGSGAVVYLTVGAWFKHKGVVVFSENGDKYARIFCYCMIIPIIILGPFLGVIAPGLIFGAWQTHPLAAYRGSTLRIAVTYGIIGIFVILFCWVLILNIRISHVLRSRKKAAVPQKDAPSMYQTNKNPELIWIFLITVAFGLIRGCTGTVALYKNKIFVWNDDVYFYCLNVLPDYLVLTILCWPKLLARISCAYPPQKEEDFERADPRSKDDLSHKEGAKK